MLPGKPYNPGTFTSRRPTPERFAHLRKWVTPIDRFQQLTSIEEIYNVTQQLEQSSTLFINNIIQRVIAQIVGKFGAGFVTIEGTEDGALHVYIKDIAAGASWNIELDAGTNSIGTVGLNAGANLIGKVQVQGPGQTMISAEIDKTGIATHEIMAGTALKKHKITSLLIVVGGQTNITLASASTDLSGPLDLGGTNEPRGFAMNHGAFPLECGVNEAFNIVSSGNVQVSGYVIYYDEA